MVHSKGEFDLPREDPVQTALNAVPLAVLLVDRKLKIRWINRRAEILFGGRGDPLAGRSIGNSRGSPSTCFQALHLAEIVRTVFRDGGPIAGKERHCTICHDGGRAEYLFRINASPITLAGTDAVLLAIEDITELKRAEERGTERETLSLAIRMARATTHELNQPLSVLMGNLDLLIRNQEAKGRLKDRIARISKSADRVAEIVRQLQSIIRSPQKGHLTQVGPAESRKPAPGPLNDPT
ncbi:MAG: PAS domain-containing protein [Deltaproteobacteria bacterium]|nr:PAS domain-containing protein [Deltaproteobacteria bacterium]